MAQAHLNGSLNLPSAEDVFRTVSEIAGDTVVRIPDGETGERRGWIAALIPRLREVSQLEEGQRPRGYAASPVFRIKPGVRSDEIEVPELGYAQAARHSYALFQDLRDQGVIASEVRFQVSLPTVIAGCDPFMASEDQPAFYAPYSRRLRAEVDEILAAVDHADLALQWDVAVEMAIVEHVFPTHLDDPLTGVVEELAELAGWVPEDVPLGYHLCYGNAPDEEGVPHHWKEPADAANLVAVANAVTERSARSLQWFSMPVPINRDDDAYFEPLADLRLHDGARLYLGLVHHQDGAEGTQRRIGTAKRHADGFGVATECGMGREPESVVPELLRIQATVKV